MLACLGCQGPIVEADPHGPEAADLLEMRRTVRWIALQEFVVPIREPEPTPAGHDMPSRTECSRNASKGLGTASAVLPLGFTNERIESPSGHVRFELSVPNLRVVLGKPLPKTRQILLRKTLYCAGDFCDGWEPARQWPERACFSRAALPR